MGSTLLLDATLRLLFLTAATVLLGSQFIPAASKTFPGDAEALRRLKALVDPASVNPGSCLTSWDFSAADPCDALFGATRFTCGFHCDARDDAGFSRVTDVSLDPAGYSGALSPSVWSLPYLLSLDLPDNRFSGPIPSPPQTSDLRQLRRMTLSRNAFSGEIPGGVSSLPSLEELYLDNNLLIGPVPAALGSLQALTRLELQMNNLSGELPDLSPMTSLTYLDASDNAISGRIPPSSALPPQLGELSVRSNALEGPLPEDLAAGLDRLQVLDLSHNGLSGRVPAALFAHPALQQLSLSDNQFTSLGVPPEAKGWRRWTPTPTSSLVAVDLGHNRLAGMLPLGFVVSMPRLTALTLEDNQFTGMIPMEYAVRVAAPWAAGEGVVPLARLVLSGNYLYGPIPSPLTNVREGDATVSLANNCLFRCPEAFFFCQGGRQKQPATCRDFNPFIP